MKRILSAFLILLSAGLCAVTAQAAPPQVNAVIRPDSVTIGDRFTMEVTIRKDMMQMVSLPEFREGMLAPGIEIVSESTLDTVSQEGRMQTLRKVYELTSFDEGIYSLNKYPILYGDKNITDTLYSPESLSITVGTLPVDAEKETIFDIKAPEKAPLMVAEVRWYIIGSALLLCVLFAVGYLIRRALLSRKRSPEELKAESIPPHVRAIHELETLHNQKLWQSGRQKQYYTRLTDIIRAYLEGRYGINAMEKTSDEIVRSAAELPLSDKNRADLGDLLRTADLVKFAKYAPEGDYNEKVYYAAYYFVEDTKHTVELQVEQNEKCDEK